MWSHSRQPVCGRASLPHWQGCLGPHLRTRWTRCGLQCPDAPARRDGSRRDETLRAYLRRFLVHPSPAHHCHSPTLQSLSLPTFPTTIPVYHSSPPGDSLCDTSSAGLVGWRSVRTAFGASGSRTPSRRSTHPETHTGLSSSRSSCPRLLSLSPSLIPYLSICSPSSFTDETTK